MSTTHIAVIGAGPGGLTAVKYLKEEGFQVTCFERRPEVGGIWTFSEDPEITSTTLQTKSQLSKFISAFSDFPFPKEYPLQLTAPLWSQYFKDYASRFDLYDNITFNVHVDVIKKSQDGSKWLVFIRGEESPREFDKVLVAAGTELTAQYPAIDGLESFRGRYLHGQAFKKPESFAGMTVMVIGMGNSAADCACELVGHASSVYLSHRVGATIVPRTNAEGKPLDAKKTWALSRVLWWLDWYFPWASTWMVERILKKSCKQAWGVQPPEWGFEPAPSAASGGRLICINDDLIPNVRDGKIISVPDVQKVTGPYSVEMASGEVIERVDAIIACTGYVGNETLVEGVNKTTVDPALPPLFDLYMNIFPPDDAQSLAFLNHITAAENISSLKELMAMAVAQVWAGKSKLPPREHMMHQIREEQANWKSKALLYPRLSIRRIRAYKFMRFVHEAAGTGLYEYLGWTWKGWRFWWTDRSLHNLLTKGVYGNHACRLFETGKRSTWPGARDTIVAVNNEFQERFPSKRVTTIKPK